MGFPLPGMWVLVWLDVLVWLLTCSLGGLGWLGPLPCWEVGVLPGAWEPVLGSYQGGQPLAKPVASGPLGFSPFGHGRPI